ncbi:MAG: glycosyltransferase [Deltaproteobacteria bacterium]|nr:glycosyltransferase [Deltaproteobacteria bacterium]
MSAINAEVKERPFFTILTASLNGAATIGDTLQSIRSQTFGGFEHIVLDGGSRDGTQEVLRAWEDSYPLIWKSEHDLGIADALNKGLRLARGEYILVLQADDRFCNPDSLGKIHDCLAGNPCDFLILPVLFDHPEKGRLLLKPVRTLWWNHFKFIFCHQGCFENRRVFERIGEFRTAFSMTFDYDHFYRALAAGCSVRFESFPATAMGGHGVSSCPSLLRRRLAEEYLVQRMNETHLLWRMLQQMFRMLYLPYKHLTCPALRKANGQDG